MLAAREASDAQRGTKPHEKLTIDLVCDSSMTA